MVLVKSISPIPPPTTDRDLANAIRQCDDRTSNHCNLYWTKCFFRNATKMNHKQNVMELTQVWMPAGLTCTVFLSQPVDKMTSENTRANHHRITQV